MNRATGRDGCCAEATRRRCRLPRKRTAACGSAAYVQTYLERDLRQLSAVSSLPDFQRVMMLAAQRTGKLLNQADLARDAALSHPTSAPVFESCWKPAA